MDFVNETGLPGNWCLGFDLDGREVLVVVVKATYTLPIEGDECKLADEQVPLVKADEFTGEPGLSATLYETDFSHRKPMCDVLVVGSAHAPKGEAKKVTVGLKVGPIHKRFEVVGHREWDGKLMGSAPSDPKPFAKMPISYDRAYGGADANDKDEVRTYADNPIGVGYYPYSSGKKLNGRPLPNTQEIGKDPANKNGKFRPMSFGPIGRNFSERVPYAGTYDQKWMDERVPLFPRDFDDRYFQCAPADQQMPYPKGGEMVQLENLTPNGTFRFDLPRRDLPILVVPHEGKAVQLNPVVDTVMIEPDLARLTLAWRASLPLTRDIFEVARVVVAKTLRRHEAEVEREGKTRYANLAELVRAQQSVRR